MKKYFLHNGQVQQGPFDLEELKAKNISADTFVWFDTLQDWTPAKEIEELKPLLSSIPPVFKTTSVPTFNKPLPSDSSSNEFEEQPKRRIKITVGFLLVCIICITVLIYFINHSSNSSSTEVNPLDTSTVYAKDKQRLDSLEQLEKGRQERNQILTKKNMEYRNNWKKYIEFNTNQYRVDNWGGIYGLEINVTNKTDNIIDEVVVTVYYYKTNGELYTTKEVYINNIQPHSNKSTKVPDTNRGTRINTEISKITARSIHFCYDNIYENVRFGVDSIAGMPNKNPDDPWFCK